MDLNDLLRAREAKRAAANALVFKADVTAEETTQAEAMITEIEAMDRQIAAIRKTIGQADTEPPIDGEVGPTAAKAVKAFGNMHEQLQAVRRAATGGGIDSRLMAVQAAALGGNTQIPADGGWLVQTDFTDGLLEKTYATGQLTSRCAYQPITAASNKLVRYAIKETSRATGSRYGGIQVYWRAEAATIQNGGVPDLREVKHELKELTGLCYLTQEQLDDGPAMEAYVRRMFPLEFAFKLDDGVFRGPGAGQMLGILKSGALTTVAKEAGQAADSIVAKNISKIWSRCWAPCRPNAVWLINQECEPQLDELAIVVGTGGFPLYMPSNGLSDSPYGRLKGRPVIPIEQASALGDAGDIVLADLSQYEMAGKGGLQSATSIHVQFLTAQTAFRWILRIDGQPVWEAPLTPYKGNAANTLSPFVALAERA